MTHSTAKSISLMMVVAASATSVACLLNYRTARLVIVFAIIACQTATGSPRSAQTSGPLRKGFEQLATLRRLVERENACALPGCSIVYDRFLPVMWRAVSRGYVHDDHAAFVQHSLTHGFDLGFDPTRLARHGRIVYQPYASALENAEAVADAIFKRIDGLKTLCLGEWQYRPHDIPFDDCLVFPCGAVEKNPLYAPGEYRPVSDHTKSGFNPACIGDIYAHVLATHRGRGAFLAERLCYACF